MSSCYLGQLSRSLISVQLLSRLASCYLGQLTRSTNQVTDIIYLVDEQVHKQPVQSATIDSKSYTPEFTNIEVNYVSQAIVTEEINNLKLQKTGECQQRSLF